MHIKFENLNFQIVSISIMMHYWCLETSIYVPITCVIFHATIIDQVQIQCSKAITKLNGIELEKRFFAQDIMDALGLVYSPE